MSIETWKLEFYPVPADVFTPVERRRLLLQAIEHSIRKWTGLLPRNLQKHNVAVKNGLVVNTNGCSGSIEISSKTCALCKRYNSCTKCPLYKSLGTYCDNGAHSPYRKFTLGDDPKPMIKALKKALKAHEKTR